MQRPLQQRAVREGTPREKAIRRGHTCRTQQPLQRRAGGVGAGERSNGPGRLRPLGFLQSQAPMETASSSNAN